MLGKASIITQVVGIGRHMAKSDSFFIRAVSDAASGGAYAQEEIDLGSFVNLGVKNSTLLRIHNIVVQYADGTIAGGISPELPIGTNATAGGKIAFQLTTQSQTSMVPLSDKSVVASGALQCYGDGTNFTSQSHDLDVGPQSFTQGMLIGVDSLFFGTEIGGTVTTGDAVVAIMLECTLENATQASATALALSQQ